MTYLSYKYFFGLQNLRRILEYSPEILEVYLMSACCITCQKFSERLAIILNNKDESKTHCSSLFLRGTIAFDCKYRFSFTAYIVYVIWIK